MPDDTQNPLGGAQSLENRFEALWQAGAFDSQNPKEAAQLQAERAGQQPSPKGGERVAPESAGAGPVATPEPGEAAAASATQEEPEYVNLDDYLQKAGLERESFLSLPVRVKDQDVTLADVLKGYESGHDYTSQTAALTQKQQAFEAERTQQAKAFTDKLQFAETLGNIAYQELIREYNSVDWNTLAQTDPGRAALLQTQFQQRNATLQNQLSQIQGQRQEQAKQEQSKFQETLKTQQDKLLQAMPEWRDATKFKAARELMTGYAHERGFSDDELNAIYDHRYMQVLHDAAQWRNLQSQNAAALKKVRAAPQISNPGARTARDPAATQAAQAKQAFHKNPRSLEAQQAFADSIASRLS